MELIPCNSCGENRFRPILTKESPLGESFSIVSCVRCGLVQVNPQPDFLAVKKYYDDSYFTQRTERGYDNYYSDKLRTEISRVFQLNLKDLDFFLGRKIVILFCYQVKNFPLWTLDVRPVTLWHTKKIVVTKPLELKLPMVLFVLREKP